MKKRIFAVLTAVMLLSCSMTALAAPSVTTNDTTTTKVTVASDAKTVVKASDVNGATASTISETDLTTLANNADTAIGQKGVIKAAFDLTPGSATKGADGKYTVTVKVANLTSNAKVKVLHLMDTQMEILDATVNGQTVTFKTSSMSPFAIVELASVTSVTSPATGFVNTVSVWPIVAIICVAGLGVIAIAKKRAN